MDYGRQLWLNFDGQNKSCCAWSKNIKSLFGLCILSGSNESQCWQESWVLSIQLLIRKKVVTLYSSMDCGIIAQIGAMTPVKKAELSMTKYALSNIFGFCHRRTLCSIVYDGFAQEICFECFSITSDHRCSRGWGVYLAWPDIKQIGTLLKQNTIIN